MSIENIFQDASFRSSSTPSYPNRIYGNGKTGAVVVVQGKHGTDFALGVAGLDYVIKAEAEGRIEEAYVVLAKTNGGSVPAYVASAPAKAVAERLRSIAPRDGKFGPYHWITETLHSVNGDAEVPF
jgi:hypothetical protein